VRPAVSWFQRLFSLQRASRARPSLHTWRREGDGRIDRYHLRTDADGSGLLLANASAALRLSPAGVSLVQGILDDIADEQIVASVTQQFTDAVADRVRDDLAGLRDRVRTLATGGGLPALLEEPAARAARLSAPLQADVDLAPPEQMVRTLDALWSVVVPVVTLRAQPGSDPTHIVRAVERAEDLGMICGLRATTSDLMTGSLLDDVVQAGVDSVTVPIGRSLAGAEPVLDGLAEAGVCVIAEAALIEASRNLADTLPPQLAARGIGVASFPAYVSSAPDDAGLPVGALPSLLTELEELGEGPDLRVVVPAPTRRAGPLDDQLLAGPRCSGDVAVRVTASGDVIPPRGSRNPAGNLHRDSFHEIWDHPAFEAWRRASPASDDHRCPTCPCLAVCAAGCVLAPTSWSDSGGGS